jgi:DNA-binding MarR family transcriptional regulator/GNAT superfamily N-acetyltransferase
MDTASVAAVRRFTRSVTQRVGALDDGFLARGRPLGEARLLWEIGGGRDVRSLREALGLDSGYLSRLLRSLEADGLVVVEPRADDRRARVVRLTPAGAAERAELDARGDQLAASLLAPLTPGQRERLVAAMSDVERLLSAGLVEIAPADPRHPDARRCLDAYVAEIDRRMPGGFDPGASIPAGDDDLRPPAGLLLLARLHGEPVGCGALKLHGEAPAEIKRMWVSSAVRGLGVGRRLLEALEREAAARGAPAARLETNRALAEAIAMYRAAGYREVAPFNDEPHAHHWFEKPLGDPGRTEEDGGTGGG